jgi:hypothetical protein
MISGLCLKVAALVLVLAFVATGGCLADIHANDAYVNATVIAKHIDHNGDSSFYVVVTDQGPFEINRPVLDTFNSSRNPDMLYGEILVNHTYRFHTYGFRFDPTYDYPIIVGVTEL